METTLVTALAQYGPLGIVLIGALWWMARETKRREEVAERRIEEDRKLAQEREEKLMAALDAANAALKALVERVEEDRRLAQEREQNLMVSLHGTNETNRRLADAVERIIERLDRIEGELRDRRGYDRAA